jgi:hypothetical protein
LHRIERLENALMSGTGIPAMQGTASSTKAVSGASPRVSKDENSGTTESKAGAGITEKTEIDGSKEVIWIKPSKPAISDEANKGQAAAEASSVATKVQQENKATKRVLNEPVMMVTDDVQPVRTAVDNSAVGNSGHAGAAGLAAGAEASAVDVETIQKYWPQVMRLIKEKKRARYPFFAAAKVKRIEEGRLVLAVKPAERQFIENQESLSLLRNALKIASGIDIQIVCEALGETVRTVAVSDPVVSGDIGEDHDEVLGIGDYIKRVQDTFGAKIVEDITLGD